VVLALSDVVRLLVFPLVVLLAGAAVSGVLIPALTRRRDDHRKAVEIKTDLVSEMSEAVTEFMTTIQFAVLRAPGQDQKAYDEAFRTWEVRSAVIGTKLEAYFPATPIGSDWGSFAERVTQFYATTGFQDRDDRRRRVEELLAHYGVGGCDEVASALSKSPTVEEQRAGVDSRMQSWRRKAG
jgi:hypothetical protein